MKNTKSPVLKATWDQLSLDYQDTVQIRTDVLHFGPNSSAGLKIAALEDVQKKKK